MGEGFVGFYSHFLLRFHPFKGSLGCLFLFLLSVKMHLTTKPLPYTENTKKIKRTGT
jgi:hypothetical protein